MTEVKQAVMNFDSLLNQPQGTGRDYWDDTGQIFFTGNQGFGVTPELINICLGNEFEIQVYLKGGNLPRNINQEAITELQRVKEIQESGINGTIELQKPGAFRSRTAGKAKRGTTHVKPASVRKRLPGDKVKRQMPGVSGR